MDDAGGIWLVQGDGTQLRRFTPKHKFDMLPAWSPDGRQIAITSHRDGNWNVYILHLDQRKQDVQVTRDDPYCVDSAHPSANWHATTYLRAEIKSLGFVQNFQAQIIFLFLLLLEV